MDVTGEACGSYNNKGRGWKQFGTLLMHMDFNVPQITSLRMKLFQMRALSTLFDNRSKILIIFWIAEK